MGIERKVSVISSARNFFPKGAFFYSTRQIAELAKEVDYEGIEFFPTWRVCWEVARYGKLLAQDSFVASLHRDWRFDRVMEARLKGKPDWRFQLREKADRLFPPSEITLKVLQKLELRYHVPVSTSWFSDTKNFSPVMLELWSPDQGIDYNNLLIWLNGDPKGRGVVLDTAKFTSWLKENRIENQKVKVFKNLLPQIYEVHYRSKKENLIKSMNLRGELRDDSEDNLKFFLGNGFSGRIVVEFGWPDLDKAPFGLLKEDLPAFIKLHKDIISFIKGL